MIWFLFKYVLITAAPSFFLIGLLPSSESQLMGLLVYSGSFGIVVTSYLEYDDWLSIKFWRK